MDEGQIGIVEELHAALVDERDLVTIERKILESWLAELERVACPQCQLVGDELSAILKT
jgi:hypothetical protein